MQTLNKKEYAMTKAELVKKLEGFDDDAVVEVSVPSELEYATLESYKQNDKRWLEIEGVDVPADPSHCLIFAWKTVMW